MQLKEKPLWLFLQRREVRESLLVFLLHTSLLKSFVRFLFLFPIFVAIVFK